LPCHIFVFIIHLFLSVALTFPDDFIFRFFHGVIAATLAKSESVGFEF